MSRLALSAAFALLGLSSASAQLVVELPFDAGVPAREMRGIEMEVERLVPKPLQAARPFPDARSRPIQRLGIKPLHPPASSRPLEAILSLLEPQPTLAPLAPAGAVRRTFASLSPPPPEPLVISSFDGTAASGGIRAGTTWVGNVSQGSSAITIGGAARDDNGWGATGLSLDASGQTYITITAQRDPGHAAGSLFLQLEDRNVNTRIFGVDTSLFAVGAPTQVQIVIGVWSGGFDFTQITGWNIGGGSVGRQDFRMTLHDVTLTASAIPEPATVAVVMGFAALAAGAWRRRYRLR